MDYKKVTKCRICKSPHLVKYLDLGDVPLANKLLKNPLEKSKRYPIQVLFCQDCNLSQLSVVVKPKLMYSDYLYYSSVSQTFKDHCFNMAKHLRKSFTFKNDPPTCMDIASNDGCLLREFRKHGFIVRGFEPCKEVSKSCWYDLIPIINQFFTYKISKNQRSWTGEDVITATNVFAHVDDIYDFIKGVKYQQEANPKGIFIAEFPYLANLIKHNQFDTIYHEHLSYFLLKPLKRLFENCGMPIFKVEQYPIHGGSIRIYASIHKYPVDYSVGEMLDNEQKAGLYELLTYFDFAIRVDKIRDSFLSLLEMQYRMKEKVIAYGASAKGISLLNYCDIPREYIHSIVDDTPAKQRKFTPGTGIAIKDYSEFSIENPSHIILLAWNFATELISKTSFHRKRGGYYIVPIPEVKII